MSLPPNLPHTVTEDNSHEECSVSLPSAYQNPNVQPSGANMITLPISLPIATSTHISAATIAATTTSSGSNGNELNSWSLKTDGRQLLNGSSPHVTVTAATATVPDDLAISMIRHHHDGDEHEEEEEEEEAEIFDNMTTAQMRMGAIFGQGGEDSGEMMQMRSDNNIMYVVVVETALALGWILIDDDFVTIWFVPIWLIWIWIYVYLLPERFQFRRLGFKSFAQMFAIADEINSARLNKFVPHVMMICATVHAHILLIISYVWLYELPGIPRKAANWYTAKIQADPDWGTQHPDNAAQIIASFAMIQPIAFLAVGFFFLYAATRTSLSPRSQAALHDRRAVLGRCVTLHRSGSDLLDMVKGMEKIALARLLKRWTMGKIILTVILSLVNGLLPFIFQQELISMAYNRAPIITMFYLFSCLSVAVPGTVLMCVALDYVCAFFLECAEWMNQLKFLDLDLTEVTDLMFWQELRAYYLRWKIPVAYGSAQYGFGICLGVTLIVYSSLIVLVFVEGTSLLYVPGIQIAWFITSVGAVNLVQCLIAATSVWDSQQSHIGLLEDVMMKLKIRLSLTATPSMSQATTQFRLDEVTRTHSKNKPRKLSVRQATAGVGGGGGTFNNGTATSKDSMIQIGVVAAPSSNHHSPNAIAPATLHMQNVSNTIPEESSNLSPATFMRIQPNKGTLNGVGNVPDTIAMTALSSVDPVSTGSSMRRRPADSTNISSYPRTSLRQVSSANRYNKDYILSMLHTLECQVRQIKELDPAPTIFGIYIKPTLLRVMAGYLVSAVAVIITKFLQG